MNPDPACNCCPPASCDACAPQCSSADPYVMVRAERPLKSNFVCSTKNCNIFGSYDTNPMPEYPCRKKNNKIRDVDKNSLGSPIGLAASNVNFKTEGKPSDIIQARYATYLKAFARLHLNTETSWDSLIIDDIMKEGLILYSNSQKEETNMESQSDIYTPTEVTVLREFELSDFSFHIELMPPFKLNTTASSETGAKGDGVELTLKDLMTTLKRFFRQHKYGLLTVGSFYALIWRSTGAYFIFDVCGRRESDLQTDKDKGVAMLICLSSLENVRNLIVHRSGLQISEPVTIREMKVVKVITPGGAIMQQDYGKRTHQYQVVNDDYAYLRSELHLTLNRRDLLRNRSALPVAVTAIVVSKMDHPATWDMRMVDKIICFGVNFCQKFWVNCKAREIVDVAEFPTYFTMGQFQITIEIMAHKYEGTWRCVPGFKHSELAHAIKKAFEAGEQKLLVQINYQMYAIWKKTDFIYLLDPYRHRILGKPSESEVYEQMEKSATVRMFGSFEVFMNVFNHILLDSNRTSQFFIHIVKVKNIQTRHAIAMPVEDTKLDANGEILSINEHICFEEGEHLCRQALGEISDYEDEDLKSDVVEMELRTSSSEAEVMEEEEAGAGGELEEMEGLESSSSGEEGSGHKKKSQSGKGGKGGKGKGKGKGSKNKGGSGKGKKGKGTEDNEVGGKKRKKNKGDSGESSEDEAGKTKKIKKVKNEEGDEKTNKKDKNQKNKGGDQQETDNENKTKDDKSTADDKSKQAKTKQDKEDIDKISKDKYGKDNDGKDNDVKGKDGKDKDGKDKDGKDKDGNDKDGKDKDGKDKDGKDKDGKDKDGKDKYGKDKDGKDKDGKDKDGKDKQLKENEDLANKKLGKNENEMGKDKDQGLGLGKDADRIDPNLARDKTEQNKGLSKTDLSQDKTKLDKSDKNLLKDDGNGGKPTEQPDDGKNKPGQSKNKDEDSKQYADRAKGSGKENVRDKDPNKPFDKDLSGDKTKDIDKTGQDLQKDINETNKIKDKLNRTDQLNKDLKHKATKGEFGDKNQRGGDRSQLYDDGTEADDENEDYFKKNQRYCSTPNPNRYPGYFKYPADMAVVGSESGSYASICKLFQAGFKMADRLLTMTPWGNFVIFCCSGKSGLEEKHYFLFDGCTCNYDRFRHLDLSVGTAGLICFKHIHNVIEYIRQLRKSRRSDGNKQPQYTADDICLQYCSRSSNLLV